MMDTHKPATFHYPKYQSCLCVLQPLHKIRTCIYMYMYFILHVPRCPDQRVSTVYMYR